MRIHFIAIGGSVMHNLALTLHEKGFSVSGSDDEIYNPARERLQAQGLLPEKIGWHPERITPEIDAIILGMHARKNNPELAKAQELGLPIYSYPAYIFEQSKDKKRIVVTGSHGKTTTTSMILHVLKYHKLDFDFLVGAQLEGFDKMVRLSDAPILVAEGDEYPSSPIDLRPKILNYQPHIAIITGIAWDHINVFTTFEMYVDQFRQFLKTIQEDGTLIYYEPDEHIQALLAEEIYAFEKIPYTAFNAKVTNNQTQLLMPSGKTVDLQIFGKHNLANLHAAWRACQLIGITEIQFLDAISSFTGAAKRLQLLRKEESFVAWLDFAHAPSKVRATIQAVKAQYPERNLVACLELHTFSSLNKDFLEHYKNAMQPADQAYVYFSEHTLEMKKLPPISKADVAQAFGHPNVQVFTDAQVLREVLKNTKWQDKNLLLMSSGTFGGMNYQAFVDDLEVE